MAEYTDLAYKIAEAFNERRFDEVAEATAPDGVITIVGSGDTFEGVEGARKFTTMWADGFPDATVTVDRVIESGDDVVVEYTARGTHTGTLSTSMGDIPATGRSMTIQVCDVLECKDGKTLRQRTYFDSASMMAQLGLVSEQQASKQQ